MKTRRVFSAPGLPAAQRATGSVRLAEVVDEHFFLIARSDMEMERIPDARIDGSSNFVGVVLGVQAWRDDRIDRRSCRRRDYAHRHHHAGVGLIALAGSAVPGPVRRKFAQEIEADNILVVVDGAANEASKIDATVVAAGAVQLPFEELYMLV